MPLPLLDAIARWAPAIVYRNEPATPANGRSFPQLEIVHTIPEVEQAPQPVPSSLYYGVGRDQAHAPSPIFTYQQPAPMEWLTVIGWPFNVAKVPSALVANMPRGVHNPIRARTNIDNPAQTPLGSISVLSGAQEFPRDLSKITF